MEYKCPRKTILLTIPIGVAAVPARAPASPAASPRADLTTGPCGAMARTADLLDAMTATLAVRTTAGITAGTGVLLTAVTTGPAVAPIVGPAAAPQGGRMHGVMGGEKTTAIIAVTTAVPLTAPLIGVMTAVRMDARPTHPGIATAGLHSGQRSARGTGTSLLGSATSSARISAPQRVRLNRGPGLPPERCSRRFRLKPSAFWICCPKPWPRYGRSIRRTSVRCPMTWPNFRAF